MNLRVLISLPNTTVDFDRPDEPQPRCPRSSRLRPVQTIHFYSRPSEQCLFYEYISHESVGVRALLRCQYTFRYVRELLAQEISLVYEFIWENLSTGEWLRSNPPWRIHQVFHLPSWRTMERMENGAYLN